MPFPFLGQKKVCGPKILFWTLQPSTKIHFSLWDLVYDYYAYPQLYAPDNHAHANYGDNTETASDDIDEFVITRNNVETNTKQVTRDV